MVWNVITLLTTTATDLYGLIDSVMQVELSWVQFLKCLSLTDLDQDSKNKQIYKPLITSR